MSGASTLFCANSIQPAPEEDENGLLEGVSCEDSKVDCEFSDGNVEEQTPWKGDMRHL